MKQHSNQQVRLFHLLLLLLPVMLLVLRLDLARNLRRYTVLKRIKIKNVKKLINSKNPLRKKASNMLLLIQFYGGTIGFLNGYCVAAYSGDLLKFRVLWSFSLTTVFPFNCDSSSFWSRYNAMAKGNYWVQTKRKILNTDSIWIKVILEFRISYFTLAKNAMQLIHMLYFLSVLSGIKILLSSGAASAPVVSVDPSVP